MITRTAIVSFFSQTKVIFATIAAMITFSITLYNQFKSPKSTEISGIVSDQRNGDVAVDAVVRISSPIQAQTETDSKGHFKFKVPNLQSDTFLLIVQNKRTNTIAKQNEYVNASQGRTDIQVLFNADMKDGQVYTSYTRSDSTHGYRRQPNIKKIIRGIPRLFH